MEVIIYKIVEKLRDSMFAIPHLSDFGLEETSRTGIDAILGNDSVTLYSLDFDTETAVFVETPAETDLSQVPFMFITQYDEALRVMTVSFNTLVQMAERVSIDQDRLVFIHSTGRCGSTLASQLFAQVPGVINLSEPFVLPQLVIEKNSHPAKKAEQMALLKATVLLLCKTAADRAWVIKEHSYALELTGWLHELFPEAKHLFLYRNAETWMQSCLTAYFGGGEMSADELRGHEIGYRGYKEVLIPAIGQLPPEPHRTFAELMTLEWLNYMERHAQYCDMGMEMLAIRYRDWKQEPQKTAEAMLAYCNCRPADMTDVVAVLDKDSQAGTVLAQDSDKKRWILSDLQRETMGRYLANHKFIHSADYEAPNTLKS